MLISVNKITNAFKWSFFWVLLLLNSDVKSQVQKGTDIHGLAGFDFSGWSVSMPDGNTIGMGAVGHNQSRGHARVYRWNGSSWAQKGLDINGESGGDNSGQSVSMPDSNTIAVGAHLNAGNGTRSGHVRIYKWNGTAWVKRGLDIDGEASGDRSGFSVSMPDSNTVAIGAYDNNGAFGHVRIYRWNGSAWVQKGIDIDGEIINDYSGYSVSMPDSNTVAIGAYGNDGSAGSSGHVRIYRWNGSAWVQKGIDIDGEAGNDFSGWSVSMPDSITVAIGAYGNDGNGVDAGHVRIYSYNGTAWVQKGSDIDGEAAGDQSGSAVSMPDANTVAIGAFTNDGNGADAGHVRIYVWNGTSWVQKLNDIDGEAAGNYFGYSVSMPSAGIVAVGAPRNSPTFSNQGDVRIFKLCNNSTGSITTSLCDRYVSPSGKYSWTASGTYTDTIANKSGCDSIITINLTILPKPSSDFTVNDTNQCWVSHSFDYTNSSISNLTNTALSYIWDFGDTTTNTSANPSKVYATPGRRLVSLVVDRKSVV